MSGFLLDTNVISEFARPDNKPDPRVKRWLEGADPSSLYASVLTFGEIRRGIEKLPASKRRSYLETWLTTDLEEWFENRILDIDKATAERWGALSADAQRRGTPLSVIDGLLSATALEHKLTVISRNSPHFIHAGVPVLNPWQS